MSTLEGHTALLTGASGGIGGAVAEALAGCGVHLVLSGRSPERLEAVADRVRRAGADAGHDLDPEIVAADLAEDAELDRLAQRVLGGAAAARGGLDLLVHALGIYAAGPVGTTPAAGLDRQLRVNLRVPWELTRRLLPALRQRRGQIVFTSSSAAVHPRGEVAAYAASKAALSAFAACLRDEVNPDGLRVLCVYPGRTASAMQEEVHRIEGRPYEPESLLQPEEVASSIVHALQLPRTAEITDLHIRPAHPRPAGSQSGRRS